MIENISVNLGALVALAAVLCAITIQFGKLRRKSRRQERRLRTANDLLKKHAAALQEFVEMNDVPAKMKERLLVFSEIISDHDQFVEITKQVCAALNGGRRPETRTFEKEFVTLRTKNADAAQLFETAINSGLAASFLRFSDASDLLEATMARVYADPRTEFEFVSKAMHKHRSSFQEPSGLAPMPA